MLSIKQRQLLALSILLATTIYAVVIFSGDSRAIYATMHRLSPFDWLKILSCSLLSYIIRFWRWEYFMRHLQHFIPRILHLSYYLAGFALTTTPGKAGETIRSLYLKPHAVSYPDSLACFVSERLLDVIVIVFLASLALLHFPEYQPFFFLLLTLLIAVGILLATNRLPSLFNYMVVHLRQRLLQHALKHLASLFEVAHGLLRPAMLAKAIGLGLLAWLAQATAFYLLLTMLEYQLPVTVCFAIFAISILAGAASFIPGGIGATEVVMGTMLLATGSNQTIAISAPILFRLSTLWFAVAVGLLANLFVSIQHKELFPGDKL